MTSHILGFPRIGAARELKFALERYWAGELPLAELLDCGRVLRARHWQMQRDAGLDFVAVGDFSFYDHVLDTAIMFGALPQRFGHRAGALGIAEMFDLARGSATAPAMEMTKWFDTNYHYIVPEFSRATQFSLHAQRLLGEIREAQQLGFRPKPVVIGPLTFLYLGKERATDFSRLDLLASLLPVYQRLLDELSACGCEWVQIDEPVLALDLPAEWRAAIEPVYRALTKNAPRLLLATYFAAIDDVVTELAALPLAGLHIDVVRAPEQLGACAEAWPADRVFSLGLVDGRNVWRCDLDAALALAQKVQAKFGERLWIAPSCSLLHCPLDLELETTLDENLKSRLAFARQKLGETVTLARALTHGPASVAADLSAARAALLTVPAPDPGVQKRVAALSEPSQRRHSPYRVRSVAQHARFRLPLLPTTTIGSFPQTPGIRKLRARLKTGEITSHHYDEKIKAEIELAIRRQEELDIDVLVHGEAERNDMVEYFGEQLRGFAFTAHGWVQSYGSRCVKPPLIHGDVWREKPMTVRWIKFAQSLTKRQVKGMLTGPVTLLQWSFVRTDQPRATTAMQLALAIRDEVCDLERAGIGMIQIDEPAFREGLPLKRAQWDEYLEWASRAFRISASGVSDATQIHTHMCYSEFHDILGAIASLDADVITIETSRSGMTLLDDFAAFDYPNEIGPGVYDIHSPRIPSVEEMTALLDKALAVIPARRLWVNPDCGLKTRAWPETEAALRNMVEAAKRARARVAKLSGCAL